MKPEVKKIEQLAHDHALWEAEMMSNILLSTGSHIAIRKDYFNDLFNDKNYNGREDLFLKSNDTAEIIKSKYHQLEQANKDMATTGKMQAISIQELEQERDGLKEILNNIMDCYDKEDPGDYIVPKKIFENIEALIK